MKAIRIKVRYERQSLETIDPPTYETTYRARLRREFPTAEIEIIPADSFEATVWIEGKSEPNPQLALEVDGIGAQVFSDLCETI